MTDDILLDRIFKRFDQDNDGYINREEWIFGLSVFLKGEPTNLQIYDGLGKKHTFMLNAFLS